MCSLSKEYSRAAAAPPPGAICRHRRDGGRERGSLGVAAPDDRTVIITLSRTDPLLPEKLAEPEAFPCREDFYTGTHARYGNTLENMIYNGPYTVKAGNPPGFA